MVQNEITFENLPKAVAHLVSEVAEIKNLVCKGQTPVVSPKRIPIGKNGKHLYFFEDELLAWIEGGKKKTVAEINEEAKTFISEKHSDSSLL